MDGVKMDWGNGIGLFLTFVGTGISAWQAYKAKSYKDEIQSDRQKLILIELMPIAKSARDECKKIITPAGKPMRGVDDQKVIDSIQGLAEKLQENSHRLKSELKEKASVKNLQHLISQYKSKTGSTDRNKVADTIYNELNEIIESLATTIDASV